MRARAAPPRRAGAWGARLALALALGGVLTVAQSTRERRPRLACGALAAQSAPTPSPLCLCRAGCEDDQYPASGRCESCYECEDGQYCWYHGQPARRGRVPGCRNCTVDQYDHDNDPLTPCLECASGKSAAAGAHGDAACSEPVRPSPLATALPPVRLPARES